MYAYTKEMHKYTKEIPTTYTKEIPTTYTKEIHRYTKKTYTDTQKN